LRSRASFSKVFFSSGVTAARMKSERVLRFMGLHYKLG
jgi:hypothetical protein